MDIHTTIFGARPRQTTTGTLPQGSREQGIERDSPVPLYHQLYLLLLDKIDAGVWAPGEAIPTEKELATHYELSRTTVRQALQHLVSDGYLYRHHGLGTFVSRPKVRHGPHRPFGASGYIRSQGLQPGWRLMSMTRVIPPRRVAVALGLQDNQEVLEVKRLRLADQDVFGLHTIYIPFPLGERVQPEHMTEGDSSLHYLRDLLGIPLSECHRLIEAVAASESEAELLDVAPDSPLLVIHRVTVAADGQPIEYLHGVYRGDRLEFYVHSEF